MTQEEYLNDPRQTCEYCRQPKDDVQLQYDPYAVELYETPGTKWRICGECRQDRLNEV